MPRLRDAGIMATVAKMVRLVLVMMLALVLTSPCAHAAGKREKKKKDLYQVKR